jgi:hypothetical protein
MLAEKVPLKASERMWLMVSGLTLSEWYVNRLTDLWIDRGSIVSAHHMIHEGLNHFYSLLFVLNNQLVADHKWRAFYAEKLDILPTNFASKMEEVMLVHAFTKTELLRRKEAFMSMWKEILPRVEKHAGKKYDDFRDTV